MVPRSRADNATMRVEWILSLRIQMRVISLRLSTLEAMVCLQPHLPRSEFLGQSFNKRLYRSTNRLNFNWPFRKITVLIRSKEKLRTACKYLYLIKTIRCRFWKCAFGCGYSLKSEAGYIIEFDYYQLRDSMKDFLEPSKTRVVLSLFYILPKLNYFAGLTAPHLFGEITKKVAEGSLIV